MLSLDRTVQQARDAKGLFAAFPRTATIVNSHSRRTRCRIANFSTRFEVWHGAAPEISGSKGGKLLPISRLQAVFFRLNLRPGPTSLATLAVPP